MTYIETSASLNAISAAQAVPLTAVGLGMVVTVLDRLLSDEDTELLTAMGLGAGARLRVCRSGGRCIVQVAATRLALGRDIARRVMVLADPAGRRE